MWWKRKQVAVIQIWQPDYKKICTHTKTAQLSCNAMWEILFCFRISKIFELQLGRTPDSIWYWKWLEPAPVVLHPSRQESRIISIKPITRAGHQCVCRGSLAWYWRDPALSLDSFHDHGAYYGMMVSSWYGTLYTWHVLYSMAIKWHGIGLKQKALYIAQVLYGDYQTWNNTMLPIINGKPEYATRCKCVAE